MCHLRSTRSCKVRNRKSSGENSGLFYWSANVNTSCGSLIIKLVFLCRPIGVVSRFKGIYMKNIKRSLFIAMIIMGAGTILDVTYFVYFWQLKLNHIMPYAVLINLFSGIALVATKCGYAKRFNVWIDIMLAMKVFLYAIPMEQAYGPLAWGRRRFYHKDRILLSAVILLPALYHALLYRLFRFLSSRT